MDKRKETVSVAVRMPAALVGELDARVRVGEFVTRSDAIRLSLQLLFERRTLPDALAGGGS